MAARGRPRAFDRDTALDAAMALFWRKGFSATSVADLCAAMGVNAPSLYGAFGSKEDLYAAAIARYVELASPLIWSDLETQPTARGAVGSVLMASARNLPGTDRPAGCMIALSSVGQECDSRLGALVTAARADGERLLVARLSRAVAEGDLPQGLDVATVARFYSCVQQGMSIQARDGATQDTLESIARAALAAWPAVTGVTEAPAGTGCVPPAPPAR